MEQVVLAIAGGIMFVVVAAVRRGSVSRRRRRLGAGKGTTTGDPARWT